MNESPEYQKNFIKLSIEMFLFLNKVLKNKFGYTDETKQEDKNFKTNEIIKSWLKDLNDQRNFKSLEETIIWPLMSDDFLENIKKQACNKINNEHESCQKYLSNT